MELKIDLENVFTDEESLADVIRAEIKEAVRRQVKKHIRGKESELAKAIEKYARQQAKELEGKLMGID